MEKIVLVSLSNAMGMQLYCSQLANVLSIDYDVSIIVTKYFDSSTVNDKVKVYKYFTTKRPTIDKGLLNINSYRKSLKIMNKCDVIHFLNSHPSNILLLSRLLRKNTVFTLHDPIPHSDNMLGKCRAIVDKIISKQSKKIIIHSKMHLENDLVKKYEDKIYVTPLASKSKSEKYHAIINRNVFLFFGRIENYKGLDIFIEAAEQVLKTRNDFKVVIAGAGDFSKYKQLIKHEDNYVIKNYIIPEGEVEDLFANATFCVMTYKSASQSGVIPLSYYYSRPVIITDIPSLQENVKDKITGFIVSKNVDEIGTLLNEILENKYDVDDLSENAYHYGNEYLSMESMAKKCEEVYFGGI